MHESLFRRQVSILFALIDYDIKRKAVNFVEQIQLYFQGWNT